MTDNNESIDTSCSKPSGQPTNGYHVSTSGHADVSSTAKIAPEALLDGFASAESDTVKIDASQQSNSRALAANDAAKSQSGADSNDGQEKSKSAVAESDSTNLKLARRASLEREWLRQCAPVFLQPTHDIHAGHALVRVFFRFVREREEAEARSRGKEWTDYMAAGEDFVEWWGAAEPGGRTGGRDGGGETAETPVVEDAGAVEGVGRREAGTGTGTGTAEAEGLIAGDGNDSADLLCELMIVYEGEASYRRFDPHQVNHLATFFYMSFNKIMFGRTADIDYLTITGVDLSLDPNKKPWRSIRTTDHCGTQTWSQGNKGNLAFWLSLFHHYTVDIPYEKLQKDNGKHRPVIYVNTANHLMGEANANPHFPLTTWSRYPLHRGGPSEAELYARTSILCKPILWNPFPGWVVRSCFSQ